MKWREVDKISQQIYVELADQKFKILAHVLFIVYYTIYYILYCFLKNQKKT